MNNYNSHPNGATNENHLDDIELVPYQTDWRSFEKARKFVHSLGLKSLDEWTAYIKGRLPHLVDLPSDIPACPHVDYHDKGFVDFNDWLGTT